LDEEAEAFVNTDEVEDLDEGFEHQEHLKAYDNEFLELEVVFGEDHEVAEDHQEEEVHRLQDIEQIPVV